MRQKINYNYYSKSIRQVAAPCTLVHRKDTKCVKLSSIPGHIQKFLVEGMCESVAEPGRDLEAGQSPALVAGSKQWRSAHWPDL